MAEEDWLRMMSNEAPETPLPAEGLKRVGGLLVRGASLGTLGPRNPPRDIPESLVEMAGSIPTVAGVSAAVSPLVGAGSRFLPLLKAPPIQRLVGAGLTGGVTGAVQAGAEGENVLKGAGTGAAQFAALEGLYLGGAHLLKKTPLVKVTGEPSTPSPVADPVKLEVSLGQNLAPETPLQLDLPISTSHQPDIFEGMNLTGRQPQLKVWPVSKEAVYEPGAGGEFGETVTPGRRGSEIRVGVEPPTLPEGAVPLPERGLSFDNPHDAHLFDIQEDPTLGPYLVPKSPEIDEVVRASVGIDPRSQGELPFSHGQLSFLEGPEGRGIKRQLDTVGKREGLTTDELLKKTPAEVEAATQTGTPLVELHSLDLTPEGLETKLLLDKTGMNEEKIARFLQGNPSQDMIHQFLKENCL